MLLSDDLLYAVDPLETSYIHFSDKSARSFFENSFEREWDKAVDEVMSQYYDFDEDEQEEMREENQNPLMTFEVDDGFLAVFEPVFILDIWGSRAWTDDALAAIDCAIKETKDNFPDIEYSGCIQFFYSDSHAGDYVKYEINTDKVHPFVGNAIRMAAEEEDFWDKLEDAEDFDAIKKELKHYESYLTKDILTIINERLKQ